MNKKIYALILLMVLLSFSAAAEKGHMVLLTVGEKGNETFGGTADVYLEIRPGIGRVFIDSFPLTKLDTQISTRFAKEVACDFVEEDCTDMDFFYTIRAKSSVVGGPSAGAALTVLTISVLEDIELADSVVMTGTINSGGIIGPVAGIEDKAIAAEKQGFKKVLVPKRSIISTGEIEFENSSGLNETNLTINYSDTLQVEGIEIVPVSTLEDALYEFTGKKYKDYSYNISVPEQYDEVMKKVATDICTRYGEISQLVSSEIKQSNLELYNISLSYKERADTALSVGDYYTAASFCFNANKFMREIEYTQFSVDEKRLIALSNLQDINSIANELNKRELRTMSDLETSMVVKERLFEARDLLSENESDVFEQLPYITERIYSAEAWSGFFEYRGRVMILDDAHLAQACLGKIAEAEERVNYLELLFGPYDQYRTEILQANQLYEAGDYTFCLFKASRIKSDANAVITSLSITDEKVQELIDDQMKLARIQINKQGENFPIIGYSYYNYASSLRDSRVDLTLVFAEYASEFSNLDMYFPKEEVNRMNIDFESLGMFMLGFSAGLLFVLAVLFLFSRFKSRFANEQPRTGKGRSARLQRVRK